MFSLSGMLATMANGLPYSVGGGGGLSRPAGGCMVGDGGFTMLMGEMATLVKYKLPVKVIVIKNNMLGQIKWEQMVIEGNPAIRRGAAAHRFRRLRPRLRRRRLHHRRPGKDAERSAPGPGPPGPAVIEAVVDPNEPPMPGNITMEQASTSPPRLRPKPAIKLESPTFRR